ncbi:MAG: hypothetical protein GX803_08920 [Lentisphaerae bacterium]|jgi:hypothetical protein|nr:hypothetical protein [Lentisphaerota bacterium]
MLSKDDILDLFEALNDKLRIQGAMGDIGLCGGAVMCVVFNARESTRDVDAIFAPTKIMRQAAREIALERDLPEDWLNDAAKGFFVSSSPQVPFREWSNLRVWALAPEFMLAMKCVAARYDTTDADDVRFLVRYLQLKTPEQVFELVSKYYPNERIPATSQFFVEELMQTSQDADADQRIETTDS